MADRRRSGKSSRRGGQDDPVRKLSGPLGNVLKRLPGVERKVVELRMGLVDGHPSNLAETARELGLTMSEARAIEKRAFARIREVVPLDRLEKYLEE